MLDDDELLKAVGEGKTVPLTFYDPQGGRHVIGTATIYPDGHVDGHVKDLEKANFIEAPSFKGVFATDSTFEVGMMDMGPTMLMKMPTVLTEELKKEIKEKFREAITHPIWPLTEPSISATESEDDNE
jgi:hypothetical protein